MRFERRVRDIGRERGTMIPLYVLFMMILLAMLGVIMTATQVYIQQRGLTSLADGGALAAANGIDVDSLYAEGLGDSGQVELVESQAEEALREYERNTDTAGIECDVTGIDGGTVWVGCTTSVETPLWNWTIPVETEVSAEAAISD